MKSIHLADILVEYNPVNDKYENEVRSKMSFCHAFRNQKQTFVDSEVFFLNASESRQYEDNNHFGVLFFN